MVISQLKSSYPNILSSLKGDRIIFRQYLSDLKQPIWNNSYFAKSYF